MEILTFQDYLDQALVTAEGMPEPKSIYLLLGLVGEASEVKALVPWLEDPKCMFKVASPTGKKFILELGDVFWYLFVLSHVWKIPLTTLTGGFTTFELFHASFERSVQWPTVAAESLVSQVGYLAEGYKKFWRNNNIQASELDSFDLSGHHVLVGRMRLVLIQITNLTLFMNSNLQQVAEQNVLKLADRKKRGVIRSSGDLR